MAIQLLPSAGAQSPLAVLIEDYLIHGRAKGLAPQTLKKYGYSLNHILLPWCEAHGLTAVEELDRRTLDRFTTTLLERQHPDGRAISRHSVASYIRPVRLMLTWASQEGEAVKAKPALPRLSKPLRDVLSREEIDLLERSAFTERDKLMIRIFADCGLRLDELTQLTPRHIVRSARQAHLRVLGKRSRLRDVPIPPQLLRRLERFINSRPADRTSDRIFLSVRRAPSGDYEPLTFSGVEQAVESAVIRSGLTKRVYPHLLRHSWMTEMVRNGMSPLQLSLIAGASLQVIMDHYTHLTKDDAYDAMLRVLATRRTNGSSPTAFGDR